MKPICEHNVDRNGISSWHPCIVAAFANAPEATEFLVKALFHEVTRDLVKSGKSYLQCLIDVIVVAAASHIDTMKDVLVMIKNKFDFPITGTTVCSFQYSYVYTFYYLHDIRLLPSRTTRLST